MASICADQYTTEATASHFKLFPLCKQFVKGVTLEFLTYKILENFRQNEFRISYSVENQ